MFGSSSFGQNKPNLFVSTPAGTTQQTGGIFGQNAQQSQPQQTTGLFGSIGQNPPQNQPSFSGLGQSTQTQQPQTGGLFGAPAQNAQQNQQAGGLFGGGNQSNQQTQQQSGLFGGLGTQTQPQSQPQQGGLFGQSTQQQQGGGLFGGSTQRPFGQSTQQQGLPQLGQSTMWQPNSAFQNQTQTIPEKIAAVVEQWDTGNPKCAFKHYFYNKVDDNMAPYYRPAPNEDPRAWEEALSKKPAPGYIPVLCLGFAQMGERIKLQQRNLANFNARLHEINNSLSQMMQSHETKTSIRAADARRKHMVLKQRCLALATKVQVLRNRGYALGGDEEDLRTKLLALEKKVNDPGLNARGEEIWARMLQVQERTRILKSEMDKVRKDIPGTLDADMDARAKKILEDYETQLLHLKKELSTIAKDLEEWELEQGPVQPKAITAPKIDTQGKSLQFL